MSLWILLLALLLTATSVSFFVMAAKDKVKKQRNVVIGSLAAAGVVAIVAMGVARGKRSKRYEGINDQFADFDDFDPSPMADTTALFAK